jgi:hypothetical protein
MAAYAAIARIGRVDPHLATHADDRDAGRPDRSDGLVHADVTAAVALVEVHSTDTLADRALRFRERWSQLTFFLFDPESWRT